MNNKKLKTTTFLLSFQWFFFSFCRKQLDCENIQEHNDEFLIRKIFMSARDVCYLHCKAFCFFSKTFFQWKLSSFITRKMKNLEKFAHCCEERRIFKLRRHSLKIPSNSPSRKKWSHVKKIELMFLKRWIEFLSCLKNVFP